MSLGKGLIFEMAEEFDELLDDEITTVTLTYTDDLIVPEIADREGIHILERAGNQLVLEYSCSEKEVKDYLSSYGLPRLPEVNLVLCIINHTLVSGRRQLVVIDSLVKFIINRD